MKQNLSKIGIVLPVYKDCFLAKTLKSISDQTNKDFKVYIGDDASPYNILEIVKQFLNKLDISYIRFEKNLGCYDLSAHWNRCIKLVNEEWIWLFSDDDLMDNNCVDNLINLIESDNNNNFVYKFQTKIIDSAGKLRKINTVTPPTFSVQDLIYWRFFSKFNSYAVEYVFSKSMFEKQGGFVSFPLAWGSDIATIMLFGRNNGYVTIPNSYVFWRYSSRNISGLSENRIVSSKKLLARLYFLNFFKTNFKEEYESIKAKLLDIHFSYPLRYSNSIGFLTQVSFVKRLLIIFEANTVFCQIKYFLLMLFENLLLKMVRFTKLFRKSAAK